MAEEGFDFKQNDNGIWKKKSCFPELYKVVFKGGPH